METVTGKIQELKNWKTKKTGKDMHFVTVDGITYSDFGQVPETLTNWFDSGQIVNIDYEVSGDYKNIKDVYISETGIPFKPADEVDDLDTMVAEGALMMGKCYEAVTGILGRKPEREGEPACVNSLFIWLTKERYFKNK